MKINITLYDRKTDKYLQAKKIEMDNEGNVTDVVAVDLDDCDEDGYTHYFSGKYKGKDRFIIYDTAYEDVLN